MMCKFPRSYFFLCSLLLSPSLEDEYPSITTSLGDIAGHYRKSYAGRTFAAFEGIPYAKPPVGTLRFANPQGIEPWNGTWNATTTHTCLQYWHGEENCLYLNVYVPQALLKRDANLDTIVYIHGGAFMVGSGSGGGPGYMMDRNVVYVSINYRVGIFGFLSTGDNVVPGNNGLKDQVLALKWIQNHIKSFGGNPDSVTITGESAGGASVHFHYLSPQSKGLFHRAIAHSGTALAPWTLHKAPLERARQLGGYVGCDSLSTTKLIDCLRKSSADELIRHVNKFFVGVFPLSPFAPVVENPSETAFITDHPYKLLASGKVNDVPVLMTLVGAEGSVIFTPSTIKQLNEQWNEFLPYALEYNYTVTDADKPVVADEIKQFYFRKENITDDDAGIAISLFGDRYFALDFERSSRIQAKVAKSPTYSYFYEYRADIDICPKFYEPYGVCHAADTVLLYQRSPAKLSKSDEIVKDILVDLITSFARNGKPEAENIDWQPVADADNFTYLLVNAPDDIHMVSRKEVAPTDFWCSLPIKEYEKIDTY